MRRRRSTPLRRRITIALVWLTALWPAAHYFVVDAYELDPWNWFGWAMYTRPPEHLQATATSLRGDPIDTRRLTQREMRVLDDAFTRWGLTRVRTHVRKPPFAFADALLRVHPGWEGVAVRVDRLRVDRETARWTILGTEEFRVRREDIPAPPGEARSEEAHR